MSSGLAAFQALSLSERPHPTTPPAATPTLRPETCEVCDTRVDLECCDKCEVVYYCGTIHQQSHALSHEKACASVTRARAHVRHERTLVPHLRGHFLTNLPVPFTRPAAGATPEEEARELEAREPFNVFDEGVGRFWDFQLTRGWMLARWVLVDTLLARFPQHLAAVEEALAHLLDMFRLSRDQDNMGLRHMVPALYLRLGMEQEAYVFLRKWALDKEREGREGQEPGDQSPSPPPEAKDADALEDPAGWLQPCESLSHAAAVVLIKMRLALDLQCLHSANRALSSLLPHDITVQILGECRFTNLAAARRQLLNNTTADQLQVIITRLEAQVTALVAATHRANRYFWGALYDAVLDPEGAASRPFSPTKGSVDEAELMASYNHLAWREAPGAIDKLDALRGIVFIYCRR